MSDDPRRIRDSAAVVLIRGRDNSLEVFWVLRSDRVGFMPGFRAFVGGTVDASDDQLVIEDIAEGPQRILRACAIREVFEETGVLLGYPGTSAREVRSEARRRLLAGEATFPALAEALGFRFRAGSLAFAGRWQTPPFAALRFDTVYFLARVPEGETPEVLPGELASGEWITPAEALLRWVRGEATFVAPILHTLLALVEGEKDLVARLVAAPEKAGQPPRRIEPKWGVVLQPMKTRPLPPATHTNAYLIGESEMLLLDPGSGDEAELQALFRLIDELKADGRRLKMVAVTHDHPDHIGGIAAVRERYRVRVGAHPASGERAGADFTILDGERIPLAPSSTGDWSLRAIHTPGHARGHLCFYHERTASLFTGDHVIGGAGTVIIDPPDGDMRAYLQSLGRLRDLGAEVIFPGHGSPQGAALRRIDRLITHRLERERLVIDALGAWPTPLPALVERVYADTPRALWSYAERSLLAHLLKLEGEGRVVREGENWARA